MTLVFDAKKATNRTDPYGPPAHVSPEWTRILARLRKLDIEQLQLIEIASAAIIRGGL